MSVRPTSRLVILDERDRVLLFQIDDATVTDPDDSVSGPFWITPGGGVDAGETHEDAARRELWEETGITNVALGPWLWIREARLHMRSRNDTLLFHERFFLVRVTNAAVTIDTFVDEGERIAYRDHRWWTLDAIHGSTTRIIPRALGELIGPVIAGDVPASPVAIG